MPKQWAIKEAIKRVSAEYRKRHQTGPLYPYAGQSPGEIVIAEMIEKYEQPPIDPDLLLARKHYASNYGPSGAERILSGTQDHSQWMKSMISAIKEARSCCQCVKS